MKRIIDWFESPTKETPEFINQGFSQRGASKY